MILDSELFGLRPFLAALSWKSADDSRRDMNFPKNDFLDLLFPCAEESTDSERLLDLVDRSEYESGEFCARDLSSVNRCISLVSKTSSYINVRENKYQSVKTLTGWGNTMGLTREFDRVLVRNEVGAVEFDRVV